MSTAPTEVELAEAVMRATKRMRKATFHRLAPFGITPSQGRALSVIAHRGRSRLSQVAERLHIAPRSATTVVDALEAAGLVTRLPDPEDRRAVLLELTPQGEETVARIAEVRQQVAEEYFAPVSPEQRSALLELLHAADAAYEQAHPHPHPHPNPHPHGLRPDGE